jgi:hypothetical protein
LSARAPRQPARASIPCTTSALRAKFRAAGAPPPRCAPPPAQQGRVAAAARRAPAPGVPPGRPPPAPAPRRAGCAAPAWSSEAHQHPPLRHQLASRTKTRSPSPPPGSISTRPGCGPAGGDDRLHQLGGRQRHAATSRPSRRCRSARPRAAPPGRRRHHSRLRPCPRGHRAGRG